MGFSEESLPYRDELWGCKDGLRHRQRAYRGGIDEDGFYVAIELMLKT
jgi:hypothetical protein